MSTCRLQAQDRRSFQSPAFRSLQAQPCGSREPRWGPRGSPGPHGISCDVARAGTRQGQLALWAGWSTPSSPGGDGCAAESQGREVAGFVQTQAGRAGGPLVGPSGVIRTRGSISTDTWRAWGRGPRGRDRSVRVPATPPQQPWAFQPLPGKCRRAGHASEGPSMSFPCHSVMRGHDIFNGIRPHETL